MSVYKSLSFAVVRLGHVWGQQESCSSKRKDEWHGHGNNIPEEIRGVRAGVRAGSWVPVSQPVHAHKGHDGIAGHVFTTLSREHVLARKLHWDAFEGHRK